MKLLKTILIILVLSLLLSKTSLAEDAEEHFQKGMGYLEIRLIDDAIVELKKALPLFKNSKSEKKAAAYSALANAYNWRGIYKAAIASAKKAIVINPDIAQAHYNLGFAYREEGNARLAKKEFALYEKLLKQQGEYISTGQSEDKSTTDPSSVSGKHPGNDSITNKKTSGKPKSVKSVADVKSDKTTRKISIEDRLGNGILYYNKGMLEEAIEEFEKVVQIDPANVKANYNLGNALLDKGMFNEAISKYEKVIKNDPGFLDAYLDLGKLYLDMGSTAGAISLYKKAILSNPGNADLHFSLGEAYSGKNQYKKAITEFKKATTMNPMDPEAQYRLAELYYKTKQFNLAIKHAERAKELGYPVDQGILDKLKKKRKN